MRGIERERERERRKTKGIQTNAVQPREKKTADIQGYPRGTGRKEKKERPVPFP
jgi:hypothetical protein